MKFKRLKLLNEIIRREGTYEKLAEKMGYTQVHIGNIVRCKSDGSMSFWNKLQELWQIDDEDFKSYMEKTEIKK